MLPTRDWAAEDDGIGPDRVIADSRRRARVAANLLGPRPGLLAIADWAPTRGLAQPYVGAGRLGARADRVGQLWTVPTRSSRFTKRAWGPRACSLRD